MDHSLNQISSQILNAVYAGLKGPSNFSVSIQQIKDEVIQLRETFIKDVAANGKYVPESWAQTMPRLTLLLKDISGIPNYDSGKKALWAEVPELVYVKGFKPVLFATETNYAVPFKIIYGNDIFHHGFDRYSSKKPTIWIKDTDLYLFNPPSPNTKYLACRMVVENPRAVNGDKYGILFTDDDDFPAPASAIAAIRNKLVNDYLRQYRLANPVPAIMASDVRFASPEPAE